VYCMSVPLVYTSVVIPHFTWHLLRGLSRAVVCCLGDFVYVALSLSRVHLFSYADVCTHLRENTCNYSDQVLRKLVCAPI